jgi:hypothetical protein
VYTKHVGGNAIIYELHNMGFVKSTINKEGRLRRWDTIKIPSFIEIYS